jgi:hypothetical protein
MRAADGTGEVAVPSYELFSGTEILGRMALERMLAGLSTRRYRVGLEPVGARAEQAATSTSRSAVSRRFVAATETALAQLLAADLPGLDLVVLMVDGVHFARAHLRGRPRDRHRRCEAPVVAGRGLGRRTPPWSPS